MIYENELLQAIHKIFSLDSKLEDIEAGLEIKNSFCPRKLYKYRCLSEYSVQNVINQNIWFDNPTQMNDPYDCRFMWDNFADRNFISAEEYQYLYANSPEEFDHELFEYISNNKVSHNKFLEMIKINNKSLTPLVEILNKLHEKMMSDFINAYMQKIYFCSFSENFSSILMWSHYSNNHTGFCIEYNSAEVTKPNPYIHQLYPIIYTDKLFNISNLFYENHNQIQNNKFNNLYLNYPLIFKSNEWEYEKEWRLIHANGFLDFAQNIPTPPISSILLGSSFFKQFDIPQDQKTAEYHRNLSLALELINHCRLNEIEMKIMQHSLTSYSIDAHPISYDECYKNLRKTE